MFDKEYSFSGKHADYVKALTSNPFSDDSKQRGVFLRNVDVFMIAPFVGVLNNRKSLQDSINSKSTTKIFTDQLTSRLYELNYILMTVVLNDRDINDSQERIENAFKKLFEDQYKEELYKKFNEYLLGGVEVLFEKIIQGAVSFDDILSNFNLFVEDFNTIHSNSTYQRQSIFDQDELKIN